jgi:hypothetical protein
LSYISHIKGGGFGTLPSSHFLMNAFAILSVAALGM